MSVGQHVSLMMKIFNSKTQRYEDVPEVVKSDAQWQEMLTEEQFHVTREHGTEHAFSDPELNRKEKPI